jgi:hypothetical protein
MSRVYARAPRGKRAAAVEQVEPDPQISVIAALRLRGIRAPMMIEGGLDGEVLSHYVEHFLVETCFSTGHSKRYSRMV